MAVLAAEDDPPGEFLVVGRRSALPGSCSRRRPAVRRRPTASDIATLASAAVTGRVGSSDFTAAMSGRAQLDQVLRGRIPRLVIVAQHRMRERIVRVINLVADAPQDHARDGCGRGGPCPACRRPTIGRTLSA